MAMMSTVEARLVMNDRISRRAAAFRRTRDARHREVAEDYVEMIGDLIDEFGEARLTDLADYMGVAHPTAAKAVQKLQLDGLISSRPYRSMFLTEAGKTLADKSRARHKVVTDFLLAIGVDEETAETDSEGIEHYVSDVTLAALKAFLAARGAAPSTRAN